MADSCVAKKGAWVAVLQHCYSYPRSEQEARALTSRFQAEREAARAQLSRVHDCQWWDNAQPHDISHAWETSKAWSGEDPEAVRAEQRITQELGTRYGITPEQLRASIAVERQREAAELAEAQRLMERAEKEDRNNRGEPTPGEHGSESDQMRGSSAQLYDSAERRDATADKLEASGIERGVVDTHTRADASHAYPATDAVAKKSPRSAKARKKRGQVARQAQRGDRGR